MSAQSTQDGTIHSGATAYAIITSTKPAAWEWDQWVCIWMIASAGRKCSAMCSIRLIGRCLLAADAIIASKTIFLWTAIQQFGRMAVAWIQVRFGAIMVDKTMRDRLNSVPLDLYRKRYPEMKTLDAYYGSPGGAAIAGDAFTGVPPEGNVIAHNVFVWVTGSKSPGMRKRHYLIFMVTL